MHNCGCALLRPKAVLNSSAWSTLGLQRSIDRDLIDEALAEEIDDETYIANLCALLRAKCRTIGMAETEPDHIARQKLIRFAAGRGYEPSLIMELVRDPDYWMDSDGTD